MKKFVKIGIAANILGVSVQTLRRWEKEGILISQRRKRGSTRYYDMDQILDIQKTESNLTIGYARVSSHDQKKDLARQSNLISLYCSKNGWDFEIIEDLGSGMNYRK